MTYEIEMAGTTMEEKNAALKAAVEARTGCCEGERMSCGCDDEHPVLSDPEDESDDVADPLHELHPSSAAFREALGELWVMHCSKSHDYGSANDPLANIRNGAEFVGIEPWRAAMVRLSDKVTRLATFNRTGELHHEAVEDSLLDLASYALLTLVLRRQDAADD
jgi:hypothetical protein